MRKNIGTPNAHRKMEEAHFFLEQLQKEAAGGRSKKSGAFGYYLSAFLSAADSVIDVARKEMQIKELEFNAWQGSSLDGQERELLCFMSGQRNQEVHLGGAKVIPTQSQIAQTFYPHVQPLSVPVMLQGSVEQGPKDAVTGLPSWVRVWIPQTEYHFQKGEAQTEPVLAECARYITVLEKFLSWAEEAG